MVTKDDKEITLANQYPNFVDLPKMCYLDVMRALTGLHHHVEVLATVGPWATRYDIQTSFFYLQKKASYKHNSI